MEENQKQGTVDPRYFDIELLRIRNIRDRERSPKRKIINLLEIASDFDEKDSIGDLRETVNELNQLDDDGLERMFNYLCLVSEVYASEHILMRVKNLCNIIRESVNDMAKNPDLYNYTCYRGKYEKDENGDPVSVSLPQELEGYRCRHMILKIMDMDKVIDTFSERDTSHRRAYQILADLDELVLESLERNKFQTWELVSYSCDGEAMFEFSHFEVNTNEPDKKYRTLYVVYRYDSTVS